jgi:hypothetical protein
MKTILLLLSSLSLSFATSVINITNTQATVLYDAPTAAEVCTVEASTNSSFSTLVPDVDPAIFTGSNLDSRAGSLKNGVHRVFELGIRRADIISASTVRRVTRALPADTNLWIRPLCSGGYLPTVQIHTATVPVGSAYAEMIPYDRANPGQYALPNFDAVTGPSVLDPLTGVEIRRVTNAVAPEANITTSFNNVNGCTNWTTPANAITAVGDAAVATVSTTDWCFLRFNDLQTIEISAARSGSMLATGISPDYAQLNITALASKVGCTTSSVDQDCWIDAALFIDGGTATSTPFSEIRTLPLGTIYPGSPQNIGTRTPMDWWGGYGVNKAQFYTRHGVVTVGVDNITLTQTSGARFNQDWKPGTRIEVAGVACSLAALDPTDGTKLTLNPCAITPALNPAVYKGGGISVGIRKHTATGGSISVDAATLSSSTSREGGMDSFMLDPQSAEVITALGGYTTMVSDPFLNSMLFHIHATTGVSSYLGFLTTVGHNDPAGPNPWQGNRIVISSSMFLNSDNPLKYISIPQITPQQILEVEITNPAILSTTDGTAFAPTGCVQTDPYATVCTNFTERTLTPFNGPGGVDQTFVAQIVRFTTARNAIDPTYKIFNPAVFGCSLQGMHGNVATGRYIGFDCRAGQDLAGFFAVFAYGDGNPAHAGMSIANGDSFNGPRVVAVGSTYGRGAMRGGVDHGASIKPGLASVGWFGGSINPANGGTGIGAGPFLIRSAAGYQIPLFTLPSDTLTVPLDAVYNDYYDPTPGAGETSAVGGIFQKRVGDYLRASNTEGAGACYVEGYQISAINTGANTMTLTRAHQLDSGVPLNSAWGLGGANPVYFSLEPGGTGDSDGDQCNRGTFYWNFLADPYGMDETGVYNLRDPKATIGHGGMNNNVLIQIGSLDTVNSCPTPVRGACYEVRSWVTNLRNLFTASKVWVVKNLAFAGAAGIARGNTAQSHALAPSVGVTNRATDAVPLVGMGLNATRITGSLWKISPSVVTDGDNFSMDTGAFSLNRKRANTVMTGGYKPLVDISSAATGNVIDGTSAGWYTGCIVRKLNECRTGSAVGEIYLNVPYVNAPNALCVATNDGSQGAPAGGDSTCFTVGNGDALLQGVAEMGFEVSTYAGQLTRSLSNITGLYKISTGSAIAQYLPGGNWMLSQIGNGWMRFDTHLLKVPQFPGISSRDLTTFSRTKLSIGRLPSGANNVIAEFWYREFERAGGTADHYCGERREVCYATTSSAAFDETAPFVYATDLTSSGATTDLLIPMIPNLHCYYRLVYRNGATVVSTGPIGVARP